MRNKKQNADLNKCISQASGTMNITHPTTVRCLKVKRGGFAALSTLALLQCDNTASQRLIKTKSIKLSVQPNPLRCAHQRSTSAARGSTSDAEVRLKSAASH